MKCWPHPPLRLPNTGDAGLGLPHSPCELRRDRLPPAPAEVSRARGRPAMPSGASIEDRQHAKRVTQAAQAQARRGSFTPTRSARTPLVAGTREHRLETPMLTAPPCRSRNGVIRRSHPTSPAVPVIAHGERRARVAAARPLSRTGGPCARTRSACASPARSAWLAMRHGPLAQSRAHAGPRAASPGAPRRGPGSADTRGAFHRMSRPFSDAQAFACDAGLSPRSSAGQGALNRLSPACGERAAPFATFCSSSGLDGPTAAKARSPWPSSWP